MITYLKLIAVALIPIALSAALCLLQKKTALGKVNNKTQQIIYGIIFGALAILGTELGADLGGVKANVRDSAVIIAGLCFGAPAGIIAGVIGGVERFFAAYWGAGTYTQIACSVTTILAGVICALLRKFMFDDKIPSALYALIIGLFIEVLNMLMIVFTNISDIATAFELMEKCAIPMIVVNGVAVMLAVIAVEITNMILSKSQGTTVKAQLFHPRTGYFKRGENRQITAVFQHWLLLCVVFAFALTILCTFMLQYSVAERDTNKLLTLNISDVEEDISDISDENILSVTYDVAEFYNTGIYSSGILDLTDLKEAYSLAEINVVDSNGIVTDSTYEPFIGYNIADGEQSSEFLVLLSGATEYVQSYQPTSADPTISRKYAGVALSDGGFIQVGYDADEFQDDIAETVVGLTRNRHIGQSGFLIIVGNDGIIVSDSEMHDGEGEYLSHTGIMGDLSDVSPMARFRATVYEEDCYCMYEVNEGYYIIAVLPVSEAVFTRNMSIYVTVFIEVVIFTLLFVLIYFLTRKIVVENIHKINGDLAQITEGNLDVVVDVRTNAEFALLSDDINSTVNTLKRYIAEAAARIDEELEFAKAIQYSALPSVFPPYPDRKELDVFASMHTAKEVGGDFYDFYFVGEDKFAVLIADVSGKGIPAAMFMMTAKTLIKGFAEAGRPPEEVFTLANQKLCENNDANMFVTAWLAYIDLRTGEVEYANAGHNPPLVRKGDNFDYLKVKRGFVLGGMEGIKYKKGTFTLEKGDALFLYTDGVTEAVNAQNELYGEERLRTILELTDNLSAEDICKNVKGDVDKFAGDTPQADDITMLCFILKNLTEEL